MRVYPTHLPSVSIELPCVALVLCGGIIRNIIIKLRLTSTSFSNTGSLHFSVLGQSLYKLPLYKRFSDELRARNVLLRS